MQPIPCNHCGYNFMRQTIDPEAPRLCNSCNIKEQSRTQKGEKLETIDILIKVPKDIYVKIEEICINKGINITRYFTDFIYSSHEFFKIKNDEDEMPPINTPGMANKYYKEKSKKK